MKGKSLEILGDPALQVLPHQSASHFQRDCHRRTFGERKPILKVFKVFFGRKTRLVIAFWLGIIGSLLPIISISPKITVSLSSPIVMAQTLNPDMVAKEIYQRLPDLPPENQYISQETGAIAPENTLVSRLVRYHQYIKSRPGYRLDWQLTLADYFGLNEPIDSSRYPGGTTLRTNPLEGDRAVIKNLSRRQRNQLIDLLASIYKPQPQSPSTPDASNQLPQPSSPNTTNTEPRLPQPGDAELLLP